MLSGTRGLLWGCPGSCTSAQKAEGKGSGLFGKTLKSTESFATRTVEGRCRGWVGEAAVRSEGAPDSQPYCTTCRNTRGGACLFLVRDPEPRCWSASPEGPPSKAMRCALQAKRGRAGLCHPLQSQQLACPGNTPNAASPSPGPSLPLFQAG